MKEWWLNLSWREKQAVMAAGGCLVLFIIYQSIWAPLTNHVSELREQLKQNQTLLAWMQSANQTMHKIENQVSHGAKSETSVVGVLSFLQKHITQMGLAQNVSEMKQASDEAIELRFQKVDFDQLMTLLITTVKEQPILITHMSAIASGAPGLVDANITLQVQVSLAA